MATARLRYKTGSVDKNDLQESYCTERLCSRFPEQRSCCQMYRRMQALYKTKFLCSGKL
jgi:hypothetical protein